MVKRIITGERDGRSVIAHADDIELEGDGGIKVGLVWGAAKIPFDLPISAIDPQPVDGIFPPSADQVRISLASFPPDRIDSGETEGHSDLAGLLAEDGFHQTDSVDCCWVISGEIGLEIDGEIIWLNPGDVVVQNGTRHAWRNRGTVPAELGCVTFGAQRR